MKEDRFITIRRNNYANNKWTMRNENGFKFGAAATVKEDRFITIRRNKYANNKWTMRTENGFNSGKRKKKKT